MNPRHWERRASSIMAMLLLGSVAACQCGDEGLRAWEPSIVDPDLTDPEVERPEFRRDTWVDQFEQRDATLDILWVVDITGSMSDHLDRMEENFHRFVTTLTGLELDYQLGVTTTDVSEDGGGGRLIGTPPVLTPGDDVESEFIERVNLPFAVGAEEGLESARRVIDGGEYDFPREGAMLAVILLTDDDDQSPGSTGFYTRYYLGAKGPGNADLVRVSAIAGDVPDGCESPGYEGVWGAGASPAHRISEVVEATGGVFGSVCEVDYGPDLDRIGLESAGLRQVFPLSHPAVPLSVMVEIDGHDVSDGWSYDADAQSVIFNPDHLPPAGSVIHVRYGVQQ